MDNETITAIAAAAGAGFAVVKPAAETGCRMIESLLGKPLKVAGNLLADQVYAWQVVNRVRIFARTKELLDEQKVSPRVIPAGFLLPVLRDAGDVEDQSLQELWARLIATAVAHDCAQHPAFRHTLNELAPTDAKVLARFHARDRIPLLADSGHDTRADHILLDDEAIAALPKDHVVLAWHNLDHLSLINWMQDGSAFDRGRLNEALSLFSTTWPGVESPTDYVAFLSSYGSSFCRACMPATVS